MTSIDLDRAIDLLASGTKDPTNERHAAIIDHRVGFADACNEISIRVADRLLSGSIDFSGADEVMNWIWARITEWLLVAGGEPMPEPAFAIYEAIDAGEYKHPGDPPDLDPVAKYTIPMLTSIVKSLER